MRLIRVGRFLASATWLIPVLCVLGSVGLAFGTIAIDRHFEYELIPRSITGSPTAAQTLLGTFAGSTATLAGLVLTPTTVAIQLAIGQFSPRIVGALLQDRTNQITIGLLTGTFAYSMLILLEVDDQANGDAGAVPGLSILVAFVLMLTSLITLLLYVSHTGQSLRAAALIDLVGDRTRKATRPHLPEHERRSRSDERRDRRTAARRRHSCRARGPGGRS